MTKLGTCGRHLVRLACVTVLIFLALPGVSQEAPVTTQQEAQIGRKRLKYTAEVGRLAIRDVETGEPRGYMFYTAYRAPSSGKPRPVTFVWNGGPGAPSTQLHFSIVGPKLLQEGHLVDNPDTWRPTTDLVLVDPIGTGFSRPVKSEYSSDFYGTVGDVASVTEFVRAWRLLHGAEDAPVFLVGGSWGAGRAASVAYALEKRGIRVDGLVLISGGWGVPKDYVPSPLRSALRVVDMATSALYYGRTAPDLGEDPTVVRREAEAWARKICAPALGKVNELSEVERNAIIGQLVRITGLSVI